MKLEWTRRAGRDKDGIIGHIAQDDPLAAVRQGDEIEKQTEMLLQQPDSGRAGRVRGTRELAVAGTPYIAAYRVKGDAVQILAVLHGAQRFP